MNKRKHFVAIRAIVASASTVLAATAHAAAESATQLKSFLWVNPNPSTSIARPNLLFRSLVDLSNSPFAGLSERVQASLQQVGPAVVRGSWIRSIESTAGVPVFKAGAVLENVSPELQRHAEAIQARLNSIQAFMMGQAPAGHHFAPQLEVVLQGSSPKFEWSLEGLRPDETSGFVAHFDEAGHLLEVREAGVHLEDGLAAVFPKGPIESQLSNVVLHGLDETGKLSSQILSATSARPDVQANSPDHRFEYPPQDPRFDQVQAYFFADQMLKWLEQHFGYEPGSRLEVKVQVGDHSNTAFYFNNQIRLGDGDNARYKWMARDPSIVMHEVVHAAIDRYAHLPSEGEGGGMNEAFADFFAASFLDHPEIGAAASVGRPYARTLKNSLSAQELNSDTGPYQAARIIGGTLWQLRETLGHEIGEALAYRTLVRLGPSSLFANFAPTLLIAAEGLLSSEQLDQTKRILRDRGWTF